MLFDDDVEEKRSEALDGFFILMLFQRRTDYIRQAQPAAIINRSFEARFRGEVPN
ncbi:MAG: hypothetical protein M3X11_22055 [Acidobacteriota bacterium]|nr:hypothetical protein [Acidobacteriota bacterium]